MEVDERKDYELLKKLQELCNTANEWDGPCSFETIWQECSNEIGHLKSSIGERIINETK